MKVAIIGLGYIGLPTAIIAAQAGLEVFGFDIDKEKIKKINNGDPVIQEKEIYERLNDVIKNKKLIAKSELEVADVFLISVPTPFTDEKKADLSYVYSACDSIANVFKKNDLVILESTVPVGTTEKISKYLSDNTNLIAGQDFFVAHCPERVLPGNIFFELINNSRIIGGINQESVELAKKFYEKFVISEMYCTDAPTAEIVKLIENSYRDVCIAFAHQVAEMARSINLNPYEIINLANKHPRVKILNPTCGVGGHCIAVDPWFLIETFENSDLLKQARSVNDRQPKYVIQKINREIELFNLNNNKKPNVIICGVSYKPDIDDLRESPALRITQEIDKQKNCKLFVCEPNVSKNVLENFGLNSIDLKLVFEHADILVCLVGHKQFKLCKDEFIKFNKFLDFCGISYKEAPIGNFSTNYFLAGHKNSSLTYGKFE
ncbi:nucleotide sugar dehydrogenase [Candidatus Dependentiae bacterium]|nr:nucleotide sugar dehydrogenase [Candidatus Dependentiae bacterium]